MSSRGPKPNQQNAGSVVFFQIQKTELLTAFISQRSEILLSLRLQLPEVRNVQNSNPDKLDSNSQSAHIVSSLFFLFPSLLSLPPSIFPFCLRLSPHVSVICLYHLHLKGKISEKAHSKQRKRCVSPLYSSKQDN